MAGNDELLDLVNEQDLVIGTLWRSEYERLEAEDLGYIRAVELFIQNENGQLWIPKRTADKRIAPNGLDYSAGGHVSSGETYMQAMLKEINEELNWKLQESDLEFIADIGPDQNRYIRKLFVHRTNREPNYNPEDFVSANWFAIDSLIALLESGAPAKSSLLPTVRLFKDHQDKEQL